MKSEPSRSYEVFATVVGGLVWAFLQWSAQWVASDSTWRAIWLGGASSIMAGLLVGYLARHSSKVACARDKIDSLIARIEALAEAFHKLNESGKFLHSLSAIKKEDMKLAAFLIGKVDDHVWRIPHAGFETAYLWLRQTCDACDNKGEWEGIHTRGLGELGNAPMNEPAAKDFFEGLKHMKDRNGTLRRIIVVSSEDFARFSDPLSLDAHNKGLVQDLWNSTGKFVDCYFFNKEYLREAIPHSVMPQNEFDTFDRKDWPWEDCAIYNRRYLIAYQRSSNNDSNVIGDGSPDAQMATQEGEVKVWTTDQEERSDADDNEKRIARLAKGVRALFDYLDTQTNGRKKPNKSHFLRIDTGYTKQIGKSTS